MSFPKGTVSNTRILGGVPKSLLNRLQHREATRRISLFPHALHASPQSCLCGVNFRQEQAGLMGSGRRTVFAPLAAHFDVPDDIKPDAF